MDKILVKFITKNSKENKLEKHFLNLIPNENLGLCKCRFTFNNNEEHYDWLVVYDEFKGKTYVNCHKNNTILITTEPSSIKIYEREYLEQFKYVLTGQEDWALKHPGKIYSQPSLRWFYNPNLKFSEIYNLELPDKRKSLSTVCSSKQNNHTKHKARYKFIKSMQAAFPEMDWYGHGVNEIKNKAHALDVYKYHIVIENHNCLHWWTEKLADAYLGYTLPFYCGAPNLNEYFPKESFIKIDINNPREAIGIIEKAIESNQFEKRLPHIIEARKRVLEEYNLFISISNIINLKHYQSLKPSDPWIIESRHNIRNKLHNLLSCISQKIRGKLKNAAQNLKN